MHLPVEMRPASQTVGLSVERQRERGVRGSTGNWGVPSPPFFSRVSHPILSPPTLSTQRAQLRSPSPHQLAPVIPHFLLNATPLALSLLTSQHPLQGNGKAAHRTGKNSDSSTTFNTWKKKKRGEVELTGGCALRIKRGLWQVCGDWHLSVWIYTPQRWRII